MGSSYSNVIVIGADQAQVEAACSRPAFVATDGDVVALYTKGDDDSSAPTGGDLSAELKCITLNFSVFESDVLGYQVFDHGEMKTEGVVPDPAVFFGEEFADMSTPADPALLVSALGRGNPEAVYNALTDDFTFAEERLVALLTALKLPASSAGFTYRYLLRDDAEYKGPALTRLD